MLSLEIMSISALRAMTKTQTTSYSWIDIYISIQEYEVVCVLVIARRAEIDIFDIFRLLKKQSLLYASIISLSNMLVYIS